MFLPVYSALSWNTSSRLSPRLLMTSLKTASSPLRVSMWTLMPTLSRTNLTTSSFYASSYRSLRPASYSLPRRPWLRTLTWACLMMKARMENTLSSTLILRVECVSRTLSTASSLPTLWFSYSDLEARSPSWLKPPPSTTAATLPGNPVATKSS